MRAQLAPLAAEAEVDIPDEADNSGAASCFAESWLQHLREQASSDSESEVGATSSDEEEDLVPEITTAHFELAMRDARRSVSDADLAKYSSFAQTMQQQRAAMNGGQGVDNFRFPARAPGAAGDNNAGAGAGVAAADSDDDVDLYS